MFSPYVNCYIATLTEKDRLYHKYGASGVIYDTSGSGVAGGHFNHITVAFSAAVISQVTSDNK
jgi:hypothetical protein